MKILLTYFLLTLGGIAASIILYILLFGIVFFIFNIATNIKYKTFNTSDNKFNITQWVDKSFEKIKTEETEYISKLYQKLQEVAEKENIPYIIDDSVFVGDNEDAAAFIKYKSTTYFFPVFKIEYKNFAIYSRTQDNLLAYTFTLAHELGHYFSIVLYDDNSEDGADFEAYYLCKSILNELGMVSNKNPYIDIDLNVYCKAGLVYDCHEDIILKNFGMIA